MKNITLLFIIIFYSFFSNAIASMIKVQKIEIEFIDCDNSLCAELIFKNKTKKPICLNNVDFDYSEFNIGNSYFQIVDMKTEQYIPYAGYEIASIKKDSDPTKVWWIPHGGSVISTHEFLKFYDLEKDKKYMLEYNSLAYFCEDYEVRNPNKRIHIKGKQTFTYK